MCHAYSVVFFIRNAFAITDTELKLIAKAGASLTPSPAIPGILYLCIIIYFDFNTYSVLVIQKNENNKIHPYRIELHKIKSRRSRKEAGYLYKVEEVYTC